MRPLFEATLTANAALRGGVFSELESLPTDLVIRKYGTHYTSGLRFGGHLMFTYTEESSTTKDMTKLAAAVRARYSGVSGGADISSETDNSTSLKKGNADLNIVGGVQDALTKENYFTDQKRDMIEGEYAKWAASVPNNPQMAGYLPDGLRPLWEIPGLSPARSQALKTAIEEYGKKRGKDLFDRNPSTTAPGGAPILPGGWVIFEVVGADGNYLDVYGSEVKNDTYAVKGTNRRNFQLFFGEKGGTKPLRSGDGLVVYLDGAYPLYAGQGSTYYYVSGNEQRLWNIYKYKDDGTAKEADGTYQLQ